MQLIGRSNGYLHDFFQFWLDCLFPKQCFVCQNEGEYLCSACFDKIELAQNKCFICNKETQCQGICQSCQEQTAIDALIIATPYDNNVAGKIVEALKYNYLEETVQPLVDLLDKQIKLQELEPLIQNKVFVPIPLHKKRYLARGFNQSELLARALALKYKGIIRIDLIKRKRFTRQQAKLTRRERLDNIKEAFVLNGSMGRVKEIVLIDDVITTGGTMAEAARTLKQAGVEKIIAVAICHG